jgi:TonB family protein
MGQLSYPATVRIIPLEVSSHPTFCWPSCGFQGILAEAPASSGAAPVYTMPDLNTLVPKPDLPKTDRALLADSPKSAREDPKQRRLMAGSLCLLLLALGIVIWHDRDFWFPDTPEAESDQPVESSPAAKIAPAKPAAKQTTAARSKARSRPRAMRPVATAAITPAPSTPPPAVATATRTVLPPLEVEVVAGDSHRTIRPGSNSLRVDLQPGTPPQQVAVPALADTQTPGKITTYASERVQMTADASDIVARPVQPSYPLLARQMKVQGSVILQAMISKDGVIQNLRVVSGPHILASAAQDAVRQWHFKPHFEGAEPVETQAKITVNFTISTN